MLTDERIAGILASRIARSPSYLNGSLTIERQRVADFYNGDLPKPIHKGNSKYVSNDVFDSVESAKAQLVEVFSGGFQPVRFMPQGPEDVEQARIDTETVNFVVDRQNDGFGLKEAVITDGLMCRMGVAKVWWEKSEETEELSFEAPEGDDGTALGSFMAQNPGATPTAATQDPSTGAVTSATFTKPSGTSQVRIMAIPPEEFLISAGARILDDADLLAHKRSMTPSELVAMGYKWEDVKGLPEGRDWISDGELLARSGDVETSMSFTDSDEQIAGRKVEVFDCWTKLDIDEDDNSGTKSSKRRLWKVVLAGGKVLEKEKVKRHPFVVYVPLPRTHTVWGTNFAERVIPTQNTRTALTRAIADHAIITTNPRQTVLRGGLPNPAELIENRIGGIININKPGAIVPLVQSGLNPFVFQTIQLLDEDKEETTGISKLSQGLNKDAISQQNSGAMVEQLVSMSQIRQKVMARRFAEHFLKPLYLEVLQLLAENADQSFYIEVAGNYVPVDPSAMKIRKQVSIDFRLGYGEQEKEAQKYGGIMANLMNICQADPGIAQAFDTAHKYEVIKRSLNALGIKDVTAIIADPKTLPPPQPPPMQQLQQQKMQADIQMQNAQAQASAARIQREEQKDAMQHQMEMAKLNLQLQKLQSELALNVRKQAHLEAKDAAVIRMDQEEIDAGTAQGIITERTS